MIGQKTKNHIIIICFHKKITLIFNCLLQFINVKYPSLNEIKYI